MAEPGMTTPRQFSLAKLLGLLTILACLLASLRVVGMFGIVYLLWAGGTLAGMRWRLEASGKESVIRQLFETMFRAAIGGAVGVVFGGFAVVYLFPEEANMQDYLSTRGVFGSLVIVGAWGAIAIMQVAWCLGAVNFSAAKQTADRDGDKELATQIPTFGHQALVVAVLLVLLVWLVLFLASLFGML